jgi:archaellum component FlaC
MSGVEERIDKVEERLGSVEKGVNELRGEVGELRGEVGELRGEVGGLRGEVDGLHGKVDGLGNEVQKLRVLGEQTASELKLVAEVQGARLDEIAKALEPLARIDSFVKLVADNHESRIQALEKRTGVQT